MMLKLSNKIIVFTIVTNTILSQIWIKFILNNNLKTIILNNK